MSLSPISVASRRRTVSPCYYRRRKPTVTSQSIAAPTAKRQVNISSDGSSGWSIYTQQGGEVANGFGQKALNDAFESLHPHDENGHFIKKSDQRGRRQSPVSRRDGGGDGSGS